MITKTPDSAAPTMLIIEVTPYLGMEVMVQTMTGNSLCAPHIDKCELLWCTEFEHMGRLVQPKLLLYTRHHWKKKGLQGFFPLTANEECMRIFQACSVTTKDKASMYA